jgi:protein-tyrosine-phosphatase
VWRDLTGEPADSAGTDPAERVHPAAVAAAERAGLDLSGAEPRRLALGEPLPPLVVTVCDRAHEEVPGERSWLHWSIPDPVPVGTRAAFDRTLRELRERVEAVLDTERLAS